MSFDDIHLGPTLLISYARWAKFYALPHFLVVCAMFQTTALFVIVVLRHIYGTTAALATATTGSTSNAIVRTFVVFDYFQLYVVIITVW